MSFDLGQDLFLSSCFLLLTVALKPMDPRRFRDNLFHSVEGSAENEQDIRRIDLDEFLMGVLVSA